MLGSVFVASLVLLGQVPEAAPNPLDATVRRLVRQLDSSELATRDEAERALIELGPDVLDHLPRITSRTPAEVKERLGRVVQAVEKAAAESIGQASRVTLQGEMTLAEAMASLQKQTGNVVEGFENLKTKISLNVEDAAYWEVLDQVLDQAQLTINPYGGKPNVLTLQARADDQLPRYGSASYSGPFRFEAIRVQSRRDLRNPSIQGMQVTVETSWEPHNAPILVSQPLSSLSAKDQDSVEIAVDGEGSRTAQVNADVASVELDLPFELPERDAVKMSKLRGKLLALIPGRVETFEFDDLARSKNVDKRRASVVVTLEQFRKNADLYEVLVTVRYDEAANALESHRGWIYNNEAFMLDGKGRRVENAGLNVTRQEPNLVGLAYLFALEEDPRDHKFVYRTPAVIINSEIDYELRDIPLP